MITFSEAELTLNRDNSAFISPEGQHYPVLYANHSKFAKEWGFEYASDLEQIGWLHISDGVCMIRKKPTQEQEAWVMAVANKYGPDHDAAREILTTFLNLCDRFERRSLYESAY